VLDAESVRVVQRRGDQLREVVRQLVEVARHRDDLARDRLRRL
jgi:hypothetical protein